MAQSEATYGEWDFVRRVALEPPIDEPLSQRPMAQLPLPMPPPSTSRTSPSNDEQYYIVKAPPTPPPAPAELQPAPLRYPDTLNTLISVSESNGKGLGVFALADILPGTVLLSESPLVTLIDTGTRADPLDLVIANLTPTHRASFLSLHHYSRNPNESLHRSIVYSNGYSIHQDMRTGVFETASRINHSCVPNSAYVWKEALGRMVFWNHRKLLEGEEVTVDYGHRPNQLLRIYGFECACGGCTERGSVIGSSVSEDGSVVKGMAGIDSVIEGGMGVEENIAGGAPQHLSSVSNV